MGNCYRKPTAEVTDQVQYYSEVTLNVKSRDASRTQEKTKPIQARLRPPQFTSSTSARLSSLSLSLSSCVLAGCDPIENTSREGQDSSFWLEAEDSLLVVLCDGHGKDGRKVVEFCKKWFTGYFREHLSEFRASPQEAIIHSCERCDEAVKAELECLLSGTSAVVMFVTESSITVGSVGDAKAVLASTPSLTGSVPSKDVPEETKRPTEQPGGRRILAPSRLLDAIQLTIDHKPNHSQELQRILENGGRVSRLTDDSGNKVGPHRVWKKNGHLPGLAASRSIGDKMASDLGVIPTPLTHLHSLRVGEDQFVVVASDGVWNVMGDEDVVNFVEKFRRVCPKVPPAKPIDPVKPSNAPISHLLAEEARLRWLHLVEAESVSIDDISCIVLELDGGLTPLASSQPDDWTQKMAQNPVPVSEGEEAIHFPKAADPLRGSMILPSDTNYDLPPTSLEPTDPSSE